MSYNRLVDFCCAIYMVSVNRHQPGQVLMLVGAFTRIMINGLGNWHNMSKAAFNYGAYINQTRSHQPTTIVIPVRTPSLLHINR